MWGNRLGWQISAGIVVITLGIYGMLIFGTGISKPTKLTTSPGALDAITIPGSPRSVVPAGSDGDGTKLYLEALDLYAASPSTYDPSKPSKIDISAAGLKKLKAVQLLVDANDSAKATIFTTRPEKLIRYGIEEHEALKPLEDLGRMANIIGVKLRNAKRADEAKKYHAACFNLGYTMCSERLTYMEFLRGQELMQVASIELASTDPSKATAAKAFPEEIKELITNDRGQFAMIRDAVRTLDKRVIKANAGDVFNLAQHSNERMWKIEAILALGHFRYNAGSAGDQRGANKVLAQLAADDSLEPPVKTAIKAAQDLTLAQHNTSAQMP